MCSQIHPSVHLKLGPITPMISLLLLLFFKLTST